MAALKIGANEKNKVYLLAGLLVVAAAVFLLNRGEPDPAQNTSQNASRPAPAGQPARLAAGNAASPSSARVSGVSRQARRGDRTLREFRPTLVRKPEDRIDPMTVDPTLRTDLLARLQTVAVEGSRRNLFEFGSAPPPSTAIAKTPVNVPSPLVQGPPPVPVDAGPPQPPPLPPVPMKFFGYITAANQGNKRAFFVEGEDIHIVHEGDVVRGRYRIVRIGVNSVVVEDTQFKKEQTVPLLEEQPG